MGLWKNIGSSAYASGALWTAGLRVYYSALAQVATPFDFGLSTQTQTRTGGSWQTTFSLRLCLPDNLSWDTTIQNLAFKVRMGLDITTSGAASWQIRLSDNSDATAVTITGDDYYSITYTWTVAAAGSIKGVYAIPVQAKSTGGSLGDNLTMARPWGFYGPDCFAGPILV